MANIIKAKRSAVPGKIPATTDLALGEIGINTYDGKAYIKKDVGGVESIVALGGAGSGDVTGPAVATDNALTRFDLASGKVIQNSSVTLDDNGNLANVNAVGFDTTPGTLPTAVGSMFWDSGNGTPSIILDADVTLQLGQEQLALVYNGTGATIQNGKVVAVTGAQGQRPSVALADADSEALSASTLGIATEDIANGAEGFVTTFGFVRGLDTSAFTAGAPVYLSQTAGSFTATRPSAPAHTVAIGWVIKVSASAGEIFVNINNGWELSELHDVLISAVANNEALIYNSATGVWKNTALKTVNGTTVVGAGNIDVGDLDGPASATDNAITRFDGTTGKLVQNSSATIDDSGNLTSLTQSATGTGANIMPVGTTAQRPASPTTGMYRMNSTTKEPEWYDSVSSQWVPFAEHASYSIDYIIVAGGGGGGVYGGGGGGAGGVINGTTTATAGVTYPCVIGAGAAAVSTLASQGNNGSNTTFNTGNVAYGGGGGGRGDVDSPANATPGSNGGSGGGGGGRQYKAGGSGTTGQGNPGGTSMQDIAGYYAGGGGGGKNAAGGNAPNYIGGAGGNGIQWVNGTYYGGGGGGGHYAGTAGVGGLGGGGAGGTGGAATSGSANTGGGGGGACNSGSITTFPGGAGGSGVVILRYIGAPRASGGTITESGGYTYHTFTTSGNFVA